MSSSELIITAAADDDDDIDCDVESGIVATKQLSASRSTTRATSINTNDTSEKVIYFSLKDAVSDDTEYQDMETGLGSSVVTVTSTTSTAAAAAAPLTPAAPAIAPASTSIISEATVSIDQTLNIIADTTKVPIIDSSTLHHQMSSELTPTSMQPVAATLQLSADHAALRREKQLFDSNMTTDIESRIMEANLPSPPNSTPPGTPSSLSSIALLFLRGNPANSDTLSISDDGDDKNDDNDDKKEYHMKNHDDKEENKEENDNNNNNNINNNVEAHTYYCKICMEVCPIFDAAFPLAECSSSSRRYGNDAHLFCAECLRGYLTSQINDGTTRIKCPYERCMCVYNSSLLQAFVPPEIFQKFTRFQAVKSDPNYRECSTCQTSLPVPQPAENITCVTSSLTCKECSATSCYFHGDAHPRETCKAYTKRLMKKTRTSQKMIRSTTKRCPSCRIRTEKNGGCAHMHCKKCTADWCWSCGKLMDDAHSQTCERVEPLSDFSPWSYWDQLLNPDDVETEEEHQIMRGQTPSCGKAFKRAMYGTCVRVAKFFAAVEMGLYLGYVFIGCCIAGTAAAVTSIVWLPFALLIRIIIIYVFKYEGFTDYQLLYVSAPGCVGGFICGCGALAITVPWAALMLPLMPLWFLLLPLEVIRTFNKHTYIAYFLHPVHMLMKAGYTLIRAARPLYKNLKILRKLKSLQCCC